MDFDNGGADMIHGGRVRSLLLFLSGSLVITFSILQLVRTLAGPLDLLRDLNVQPDLMESAIMMLEGVLLFLGGYKIFKGRIEGMAFAWVGWMAGLLLSSVSALVLLSNAFSSVVLSVEGMEGWSADQDVVPALYLGILTIALLPFLVKLGRGHNRKVKGGPQG
ncbi:MAG: hypothetical protein ACMUHM_02730 [Thermoplasmatota archaeon]